MWGSKERFRMERQDDQGWGKSEDRRDVEDRREKGENVKEKT